jgi:phenylalanyl-tRNA synthetase beta chain
MKFPLSWLKDHLDTDADAVTVAEALTRIGLEVEGVESAAATLGAFTVARVLTAAPHPQADKLQVLSVDTGAGDPVQVVCGAPNARAGLVGVFGAPGTYVPGSDLTLKVAAIRGVESRGMMCSERELLLSDEHNGIIELPGDAPVGARYVDYAGLDDPVFDVAITPNRQDCMGVHGIARDLAAAGLGTLKAGTVALVEGGFPCPVEIRTDDPDGCPAFLGRVVRGVTNGASPDWLQRRLRAAGLRPISALVDITNFISLDRGRPLHVYDVAKLDGALVARAARDGETMLALNGKSYTLAAGMTVIADDRAVHDIGGIMGGEDSGVTGTTTDVLIECAYFTPEKIAKTGQALGLTSDARTRFERGVDPAFLPGGMALATKMVLDLCGGEASGVVTAGAAPLAAKTVAYDPARVAALVGVAVDDARQAEILSSLGFGVESGAMWTVTVPSWRRDIDGAADLVEEIIRIEGLDKVPSTPLPRADGVAKATATPEQLVERRVRRAVAARGFHEAVTWSFIAPAEAEVFGDAPWTLANPISADLSVMRTSLLPGLLSAARRNLDRAGGGVRLFELGRRYLADAERPTVGILLAGERHPRDWRQGKPAPLDAFDAKAEALAALAAAGAPVERLQTLPGASAWYHPGRSGRLCLGPKQVLAEFGELHPAVAARFDLKGPVAVVELFLEAVPPPKSAKRARGAFVPEPLQAVTRDFAFVVAADASADSLLRAVRGADKERIADVALFDDFTMTDRQRSLALSVTLQPRGASFTDADFEGIAKAVTTAAAKVGATLRG